ncbi:ABC transporter permease [Nocardiopsis changdeensis]|uniref:ABC transporter permease n=1 Tax=Nocardiopsis changdeensis TaxID=2831969 RepID=A0ABX8BI73_9ACTN|nr:MULTISPECIES: ABC transporter permease [Nocardiopsis]QUX21044.1 ABC transporter permease [Nocardiopsis changdeensis]QYX36974.1 ABC transporter permease [Nocardiopsis sp. MT53]
MSVLSNAPAVPDTDPGHDLERPAHLGTRRRPPALSLALRLSVPAAALLLWWWGVRSGAVDPAVLSTPPDVLQALRELVATGQLTEFLAASFTRAALGVAVGASAGLVLGVAAGLSALGEELVDPSMQILRAVPFLALVPLFISWFGVDETFKVVLIAVSAVAPMYAYTYLGVRGVDRRLVEAARGLGLGRARLVAEVIVPTALPSILMALRICLSVSLTGLIAAEQIGTTAGIGYLVTLAQQYYRTDYMVLCVLLYAVIGIAIDLAIRLAERLLMPWRGHVAAR